MHVYCITRIQWLILGSDLPQVKETGIAVCWELYIWSITPTGLSPLPSPSPHCIIVHNQIKFKAGNSSLSFSVLLISKLLLASEYQCFKLHSFKIAVFLLGITVASYHLLASQVHMTEHLCLFHAELCEHKILNYLHLTGISRPFEKFWRYKPKKGLIEFPYVIKSNFKECSDNCCVNLLRSDNWHVAESDLSTGEK